MFEKQLTIFTEKMYHDKFEVINEVAHLDNSNVNDSDTFANAVIERELTIPTYIGYGIAIPHAITSSVNKPFVIYQKIIHGVTWGGQEEKVYHIFMIGVPKNKEADSKQHLRIISQLSKNLMRENFREKLLNSDNSEEVYEMLKTIEKEMEI